ncbi:MAG: hypothetical protein ACOCR1_04605, partial [Planctomycetota bacterium]
MDRKSFVQFLIISAFILGGWYLLMELYAPEDQERDPGEVAQETGRTIEPEDDEEDDEPTSSPSEDESDTESTEEE